MSEISKEEMEKLLSKYKTQLEVNLTPEDEQVQSIGVIRTREYTEFKQEYLPKHMSFYEKACNKSEQLFKITPDKKKIPDYLEAIEISHLDVTPAGVVSFSILFPLLFMMIGAPAGYILFGSSTFFAAFFIIPSFYLIVFIFRFIL